MLPPIDTTLRPIVWSSLSFYTTPTTIVRTLPMIV
jgi:hypothetical protein